VKGFTVYTPVSVVENDISKARIYPNPSSGMINLDGVKSAHVQVFNAVGEMVYSIDEIAENQRIDLTNLTKGVYFVQIRKDDQHSLKKIILTK